MKKVLAIVMSLSLMVCSTLSTVPAYAEEKVVYTEAVERINSTHTNWNFTDEAVDEADLAKIIEVGLNTPSGMNLKPWKLSVVTDKTLIQALATQDGSKNAPVMIVISADNVSEGNFADAAMIDAGLLTESMYITAQLLGYSAKIETSPAARINADVTGEYAKALQIPENMAARAVLFIGYSADNVDVTATATITDTSDDYVAYIK